MKEFLYIGIPILLVLCLVGFFIYRKKRAQQHTDFDTILGKRCSVTVEVNNFAGRGQVRIGKESWSCRALCDEDLFEVGETVVVVAVEGVKLVCKRA